MSKNEPCICQLLLEKDDQIKALTERIESIESKMNAQGSLSDLRSKLHKHIRNERYSELSYQEIKDVLDKPVRDIVEEVLEEKDKWG